MTTIDGSRLRMRTTLTIGLLLVAALAVGTLLTARWQRVSDRASLELYAAIGELEREFLNARSLEHRYAARGGAVPAESLPPEIDSLAEATRSLDNYNVDSEMRATIEELTVVLREYEATIFELVENAARRDASVRPDASSAPSPSPSIVLETRRLARELERRLAESHADRGALQSFLQARRYEKNYLLYGETQLFDDPATCGDMWKRYIEMTGEHLAGRPREAAVLEAYDGQADVLRGNLAEADRLADNLSELARRCHALTAFLEHAAISRMESGARVIRSVGVVAIGVAAALFAAIGFWIARAVVDPIERLTRLAEVADGDIQDHDVDFGDVDLGQYRSHESRALAVAMQAMVHRMRALVSSERGLMERHHLAILLAAEQELGPAGRALIERARAAAGFESLESLKVTDLEHFIEALGQAIGDRLSTASKHRLFEEIRKAARQQ
jgi:hypothetical protein